MKSSKLSVRKEAHMVRQREWLQPLAEERERCPECGHVWKDVGPAHFADCRYFSLDDERDEEMATPRKTNRYLVTDEA